MIKKGKKKKKTVGPGKIITSCSTLKTEKIKENQRKIVSLIFCSKKSYFSKKKTALPKKNFLRFLFFYSYFSMFTEKANRYESMFSFFRRMDVFFFLLRAKHKGCNIKDCEKFMAWHKNSILNAKWIFSVDYLQKLEKQSLVQKHQKKFCVVSRKSSQYKARIYSPFYATKFFSDQKETSVPPCLNCPVSTECHSQGIFSPFQCFHFHFWIKM
ncbi:hypothetical protein CMESO_566 (nucleomorph) [Chroomonas mesostigmatica CCMP1168]|uniref:Uncharacterized protein n=1 Tax=Chroomonas mesostigmatica CCMP1168 TaxID=1195612 RepID=J7G6M9_9CRYP|nr:hypothetical protein CMESO_15 [Chroomonas mesostigmatica CCMP1168]AFP65706.1 hypothetical protein CMESO_566 [Chroomonas mesostigmatica CCMP1168]